VRHFPCGGMGACLCTGQCQDDCRAEDQRTVDNVPIPVDKANAGHRGSLVSVNDFFQLAGGSNGSRRTVDKPVDNLLIRMEVPAGRPGTPCEVGNDYSGSWPARLERAPSNTDGSVLGGSARVDETESGGLFVHGTVRGSGDNVADAVLTLTDSHGRQVNRGATDTEGQYRMHVPGGGTYVLIAAAGRFQPAAVMVPVADKPVRRDVELEGSGGLTGVVYSRGIPVPGATVVLTDARGDVVASRATGSGGGYSFTDLVAGAFALTVTAAGYRPAATSVTVSEGRQATVDVELASGTRLTGVVQSDRSGRPIAEAQVTVLDAEGTVVASTLTDDSGGYSFTDLLDGDYTVIAAGYPPIATQLRVGGQEQEHDLRLGYPL
jgi:hypothetical protein